MFTPRAKRGILMTINVQLTAINVQDLREARKLMTINVQLMIINVQEPREARKLMTILREAPEHLRSARMFN